MRTLAIDTSMGSAVAVVDAGGEVLVRAASPDPRRHAESLAPLLDEVLRRVGTIDDVVVGTGPAPFTGLRVGLVTGRMLARALGVPVRGVSSLDALAREALDRLTEDVLVVTDARRQEVYWARYRARGPDDVERVAGPGVARRSELRAQLGALPAVAGAGALPAAAGLSLADEAPTVPDPAVLVRVVRARLDLLRAGALTEAGAGLGTEPLYLRRPDVQVPGDRKRATRA